MEKAKKNSREVRKVREERTLKAMGTHFAGIEKGLKSPVSS